MDFAGRRGGNRPPPPPSVPPVPPGGWGWGGPPWGGLFGQLFGRPARARRGNVRAAILSLLAEQPRNGYQLMQDLEARSQGAWRPSSGSVYPTLAQLEDEGLVETITGPGGRAFKLTKAGDDYVKRHADELRAAWEIPSEPSGDARIEMMTLFKSLASAAMQVFQHGTAAQADEAKRLLSETVRGLYRILAEDPSDENDD